MPIFGITASSGLETRVLGDFESIATTTLSTATSSVTFSSIPQTYKHLQIRSIHANTTGFDSFALITLNGFAARTHYFLGVNNASAQGTNPSSIFGPIAYGSSGSLSNRFGVNITDVLDYTNTGKFKTVRVMGGIEGNSLGSIATIQSGYANTTGAITSIVLTSQGTNFAVDSSFALYGIKG